MDENKMVNVPLEDLISLYTAGYGEGMAMAMDAISNFEKDSKKSIHKLVRKAVVVLAVEGVIGVALAKYLKQKRETEEKKEDINIYGEES